MLRERIRSYTKGSKKPLDHATASFLIVSAPSALFQAYIRLSSECAGKPSTD